MHSQVMKNFAVPAPSHLKIFENFTIINAIGVIIFQTALFILLHNMHR